MQTSSNKVCGYIFGQNLRPACSCMTLKNEYCTNQLCANSEQLKMCWVHYRKHCKTQNNWIPQLSFSKNVEYDTKNISCDARYKLYEKEMYYEESDFFYKLYTHDKDLTITITSEPTTKPRVNLIDFFLNDDLQSDHLSDYSSDDDDIAKCLDGLQSDDSSSDDESEYEEENYNISVVSSDCDTEEEEIPLRYNKKSKDVESIITHQERKNHKGEIKFLVKWSDKPLSKTTWETKETFITKKSLQILQNYMNENLK